MHTHKHKEQHREQHTQNNTLVHTLFTYIVLIFITYNNISKNSIIQLYTKLIHFGHLIDEVSKITNRIRTYKKLLYHDIDKPYILLFN